MTITATICRFPTLHAEAERLNRGYMCGCVAAEPDWKFPESEDLGRFSADEQRHLQMVADNGMGYDVSAMPRTCERNTFGCPVRHINSDSECDTY